MPQYVQPSALKDVSRHYFGAHVAVARSGQQANTGLNRELWDLKDWQDKSQYEDDGEAGMAKSDSSSHCHYS